MPTTFPIDKKQLRKHNFIRYKGIPPSWELIESVIKKSGLRMMARFEYVYGIHKDYLTYYKTGQRGLPAMYWHIFYDFDNITSLIKSKNKQPRKTDKKPTFLLTNKQLLDEYK